MTRKQLGLSRAELIWTAALVTLVVVLIVNTLQAEVARAKQRMCMDSLAYLASQVHIGLEQQQLTSADLLESHYTGTGLSAAFMLETSSQPLSSLLIDGINIPSDPWGQAFVLHKTSNGDLWLVSGGEDGDYPSMPFSADSLAKRVYLPFFAN